MVEEARLLEDLRDAVSIKDFKKLRHLFEKIKEKASDSVFVTLLRLSYSLKIKIQELNQALLESFRQNDLEAAEIILGIINQAMQPYDSDNLLQSLTECTISTGAQILDHPDETILALVDLFLMELKSRRWVLKRQGTEIIHLENRDDALSENPEIVIKRKERRTKKLALIKKSIELLYPTWKDSDEETLVESYKEAVNREKKYFGDESDDSDSNDDLEFSQEDNVSIRKKEHQTIQSVTSNHTLFWSKTSRPKLQALASLPKQINIRDAIGIFSEKRSRQQLSEGDTNKSKRFIAQFRGINYMHDRWSVKSRRYHYSLDETRRAQFSEAVLKTLPFDFYTELSEEKNFHENAYYQDLVATARQTRTQYYQLGNISKPIVEDASQPKTDPYLFNGITDWMQHQFTNGISQYLLELKRYRAQKLHQIDAHTLNAFNYAVSTSDCPGHALRYALGLKDYYADNFELHYNADGSLVNFHAGKIYLILHEVDDFLKPGTVDRVLQMAYQGRVPIGKQGGSDIAYELENDFIAYIPGDKVVYQRRLRFPSFHRNYQAICEIKYGMNRELYDLFRGLIKRTWEIGPSSEAHKDTIKLLKEWLCAYHEVLLLSIAQRKSEAAGGVLVYLDHENRQELSPEFVPFTPGDAHLHNRNRVHILQNLRFIAARLSETQITNMHSIIGHIYTNHLSDLIKGVVFEKGIGGFLKIPMKNEIDKKFYEGVSERLQLSPGATMEEKSNICHHVLFQYFGTLGSNPQINTISVESGFEVPISSTTTEYFPDFEAEEREDEQLGWNCFDVAVGIERERLVEYALNQGHDLETRRLLAPELQHAVALTVSYMSDPEAHIRIHGNQENLLPITMRSLEMIAIFNSYQNIHQDLRVLRALNLCNDALERKDGYRWNWDELEEFFTNEKNCSNNYAAHQYYLEGRDFILEEKIRLETYCVDKNIYEQYVREYYGNQNWFAFNAEAEGERSTGMVDIVAKMLGARIIIHQRGLRNHKTNSYGGQEIHIGFKEGNHFFKLNQKRTDNIKWVKIDSGGVPEHLNGLISHSLSLNKNEKTEVIARRLRTKKTSKSALKVEAPKPLIFSKPVKRIRRTKKIPKIPKGGTIEEMFEKIRQRSTQKPI